MHVSTLILYLISCTFVLSSYNRNNYQNNSFLNTVVIKANYSKIEHLIINRSVEYILLYNNNKEDSAFPSRVNTTLYENHIFPVLVVVRQKRGILSWQLPLITESPSGNIMYNTSTHTLCPDYHFPYPSDAYRKRNYTKENNFPTRIHNKVLTNSLSPEDDIAEIVSISTASEENLHVSVLADKVTDFYIKDSTDYNVIVSPSEPKYFFYNFENKNTSDKYNYKTVILQVNSKINNEVCMMISIQNVSCPVFDLEREVQFEGYWETINHQGGITLTQSKFPNGFYVVFVVKADDSDCTGTVDIHDENSDHRTKEIVFSITPSISYTDYIYATIATFAAIITFYIIFLGILCTCARRYYKPMTIESLDEECIVPGPSSPETVKSDAISPDCDDSSIDETDYDVVADANSEKDIYRTKIFLSVSDLARKDPKILKKKSNLYLWNVLTVAVFYGLPVIQLVIRYQSVLNDSGDQDLCYYNFLCAHPLGFLSDFNHVFSNIAYVALGLLFVLLVYRRERMHKDTAFDKNYGIPQHYGLFYAMGVGLIMEGILSGSYHVCPNHYNFQFDSSFMYVMAVLCMVKIYQTRHPDINARANATFAVLAVVIFLGIVGILDGSVYFRIMFTVLHVIVCLALTAQIYFMGRWKLDFGVFKRIFRVCNNDYRAGFIYMLKPYYKGRMVLLVIGNICNWAIAVFGLLHHEKDFATYLLIIFMGNTVLYTTFYIIMKLLHKERIQLQALTFILMGFMTWGASLYFFINKSISWALTPAQSRHYNHHCQLLRFYDGHDIWHFLSAAAMFFSFLVLLTLDDDLSHTHRSKIAVF